MQTLRKAQTENGTLINAFSYTEKSGYEIEIGFVVSRFRKYGDKIRVKRQAVKQESGKCCLSPYSQSLFDSCFKKW